MRIVARETSVPARSVTLTTTGITSPTLGTAWSHAQLLTEYLQAVETAEEGVRAVVHAYLDWVSANREHARFLLRSRSFVVAAEGEAQLTAVNDENFRAIRARFKPWIAHGEREREMSLQPAASLTPRPPCFELLACVTGSPCISPAARLPASSAPRARARTRGCTR